jgi:hypothetical protein
MKRFLSLLLTVSMLVAFGGWKTARAEDVPTFTGMNDADLPDYIEDTLYTSLVSELDSDEYFVENVEAVYISQEYLDELAYNSQANVFFGYTLAELNQQFDGSKYIFTLGDDNETTVEPWEDYYDDTFDRVIRNVAIGTGIILICVTVSAVSGGTAVTMIFAIAAKYATDFAMIGTGLGAVSAGILTGIQTGNMEEALKAAAVGGSEGFKWGAVAGAIVGGANQYFKLKGATLGGLSLNDAAAIQKESGLSLDFIKNFHSKEEYEVYKSAKLVAENVDGSNAFIREIDLTSEITDQYGKIMTNAERIKQGRSPVDPNGIPYELHHIGQQENSPLAILTSAEHDSPSLHFRDVSEVDHGNAWASQRQKFWRSYLELFGGQ